MTGKTQKLAIRLLKQGVEPSESIRSGIDLTDWERLEGTKISLGKMGGNPPKWGAFLELSGEEKSKAINITAYGLIFLNASNRWFAVSFGMGHVKLDPAKFEQDFGLRVVLNAVDPKQLKSADIRTPDENTLSRRSQTSRGSDQTAFSIDIERDIIRGLAGTPKDPNFALRLAGSDALSMDRKMKIADLPQVCAEVYATYEKTDYKAHFGWIDQIRHVRESKLIEKLNDKAITAIDNAVKGYGSSYLHLAFPVIYEPERSNFLRYKGFRSNNIYPDLELEGYLDALKERGKTDFSKEDFKNHTVHEVDEEGNDCGGKWDIANCLTLETNLDGHTYVLSGGFWYQIDKNLATEVQTFFDNMGRVELPDALADENEEKYNSRIKKDYTDLLCLDRKLVKPTGSSTTVEICDFLGKERHLIHVKNKASSSRLSHLFNQGTIAGRILIVDALSRNKIRDHVFEVQTETGQSGFEELICDANSDFRPADFVVVYAVIDAGEASTLPFFSMIALRQAARELQALGYKSAFCWIKKPTASAVKKKQKKADTTIENSKDGTKGNSE